jgi:hypothetical protein
MSTIATVGIDLAKSVLSVHAVSDRGVVQMHCNSQPCKAAAVDYTAPPVFDWHGSLLWFARVV